jgi:sigma-B regulation protein RsbU (phosphoserine phosphatase)
MAAAYEPAGDVGGDFFDAFPIPNRPGKMALVIGDVTGKGIAAALMMAFSRAVLRAASYNGTGPADALRRTNRVLTDDVRSGLLLTAVAVELDERSGRLRWACGGHEPPFLLRAGRRSVRELSATGPMLGMLDRLVVRDRSVTMRPGDRLVLWTDGVTDARHPDGERFGEARFRQVLCDHAVTGDPETVVADVMAAARAWSAGAEPADDITVVVIERTS